MSILVIDIGTTGVRAAVVRDDGSLDHVHHRRTPPEVPFPGLVEFDAVALADAALEVATATITAAGPVSAVGITNQRASTVMWDRHTGAPIGNALGWQDLRTVFDCLTVNADGFHLAPNQSATKAAWLRSNLDAERQHDVCFGTIDTWLAWRLSNGEAFITDATNAGVTGLCTSDGTDWDDRVLDRLAIDRSSLATIVDSSGPLATAHALPGSPPIAALCGDQQASLIGQGCVRPGMAKITFGTGGMLDLCVGDARPTIDHRGRAGTFPIIAWRHDNALTWGLEAIMLSAGSCVEWLRDDLGIISEPAESHALAATCASSGGVVFVPALMGLGTPMWDFGARGLLIGLTRGSGRAEICRAVLEGVAHRGADLIEAAESDAGVTLDTIRVDGGMTANPTFLESLANATSRRVEVSPVLEATTLGAGFLAGVSAGTWTSLAEAASTWRPAQIVEPTTPLDRGRWTEAVRRSEAWEPELSALDF